MKSPEGFRKAAALKIEKTEIHSPLQEWEVAEQKLEALLADPHNRFLTEIEANRRVIEESETATGALAFAEKKINERLVKSSNFQTFKTIEGVSLMEVDLKALKQMVEGILVNQMEIGRGNDAFVVIDKNEIRELPPEICYKFSLKESISRDRNSVPVEAELQGRFYDTINELAHSKIGVPIPFYTLEIGNQKMIAMEKLEAKSLDDILNKGQGTVPEWLDVELFCEELKSAVDHFHAHNLYHRDLHFGNVMVSQKEELEPGDKWGYIIDFGLSCVSHDEDAVYKREVVNETFTYMSDYGIIKEVKSGLIKAQNGGV